MKFEGKLRMTEHASEKERIAALEKALADCIALMRAMPPNPVVWTQARDAQAVLDAQLVSQPLYGEYRFHCALNNKILENEYLTVEAMLHPSGRSLELRAPMDAANLDLAAASLKLGLLLGAHIDLAPDTERAKNYFVKIEQARKKT